MAKITDAASDLFRDLDGPTSVSVASITQWLRTNVSQLNNLINTGFSVNSSYELAGSDGSEITNDQMELLKQLFKIYYFLRESRTYLGSGGVESVQSVQQDGIIVRGILKTDISKQYIDLYKESKAELKILVNNYKYNRALAGQVETDDRFSKNEPQIINPLNNASTY